MNTCIIDKDVVSEKSHKNRWKYHVSIVVDRDSGPIKSHEACDNWEKMSVVFGPGLDQD